MPRYFWIMQLKDLLAGSVVFTAALSLKQRCNEVVNVQYQQSVTATAGNLVPTSSGPVSSTLLSTLESRLVNVRSSPDFCTATVGRQCGPEVRDCERICCGRSFVTRKRIALNNRCRCQFYYCCHVTCDSCEEIVEEYFCM
jgi:hypothetical protein